MIISKKDLESLTTYVEAAQNLKFSTYLRRRQIDAILPIFHQLTSGMVWTKIFYYFFHACKGFASRAEHLSRLCKVGTKSSVNLFAA